MNGRMLIGQSGASLIQLVIVMGIMSVITTAVLNVTTFSMNAQRNFKLGQDISNISDELKQLLVAPGLCSQNMAEPGNFSQTILSTNRPEDFKLEINRFKYYPSQNVFIEAGGQKDQLKIDSISVLNFEEIGLDAFSAKLRVSYSKTGEFIGSRNAVRDIPMFFSGNLVNGSVQLTECSSSFNQNRGRFLVLGNPMSLSLDSTGGSSISSPMTNIPQGAIFVNVQTQCQAKGGSFSGAVGLYQFYDAEGLVSGVPMVVGNTCVHVSGTNSSVSNVVNIPIPSNAVSIQLTNEIDLASGISGTFPSVVQNAEFLGY